MRVALAAVLFSAPDLLLLDEPTNYLDLEGALWLDRLSRRPIRRRCSSSATTATCSTTSPTTSCISTRGKLTLWSGGYTSFERQRREQQALQGKAAKKQEEQRAHLQAFVDRFRAKATKARAGAVAPQDAGQDGADRGRSSTKTCCRSTGRRSRKR